MLSSGKLLHREFIAENKKLTKRHLQTDLKTDKH